jgi:translocation and assembly module TamB
MVAILRKTGFILTHSIAAILSWLILLFIVLQVLLVIGVNFIGAGHSTNFLVTQINKALSGRDYHVALDALYYDPVRGFTLRDLSIADERGDFVKLDRLSVSASLVLTPLRMMDIAVDGGTLDLMRIPSAQDDTAEDIIDEENGGLQAFATPDIFLRTINISKFTFDKIVIGPDIAGTEYAFSPELRAQLTVDKIIGLNMELKPGMPDLAIGLPAPDSIDLIAKTDPEALRLDIDKFSVEAALYALSTEGFADLGKDTLDLKVSAAHNDLGLLTQQAFKDATIDMSVTGSLSAPALDASALLTTDGLKEKGLSDIRLTVKNEDLKQEIASAVVHIESALHGKPIMLSSNLSYQAPYLEITELQGSAPAITVNGGGRYSTETSIFDGSIALQASDLSLYSELAGFALSGKVDAEGLFAESASNEQSAQFSAIIENGSYQNTKVRKLDAKAMLASLATPWPQSAQLDVTGLTLNDGAVTIDQLAASIQADGVEKYAFKLNGRGQSPLALSFDGSASLSGLTQELPAIEDIALNFKNGGSVVTLNGAFTPELVDLKLVTSGLRGADIPVALPEQLDAMRADIEAVMSGIPSQPRTQLTASLRDFGIESYQDASIDITASHDGEDVSVKLTGEGAGLRTLEANAAFPVLLSLYPFDFTLDQEAPLTGGLNADIDLSAITPLFMPPTQLLTGTLAADGTLSGTLKNPALTGRATLAQSSFEDDANGIFISDLMADAVLSSDRVTLHSLSATDGKDGTLSGRGHFAFTDGSTDIALTFTNFNAPRGDLANVVFNAALGLKGSADSMLLSGQADIAEMQILIPETFSSRIPTLNIIEDEADANQPSMLDRLSLDIKIDAGNQVFVRGWGLDAEFDGTLAIAGYASQPQLEGTLSSRRGRFEEFGKRFTLSRANLRFQGAIPPSPYLDIEATLPAGDVTGAILLTGSAQAPSIAFTSTPALPEDEVLSRILFDKDASHISPFQAVQLAQTIQRFSGQGGDGGLDPLGMLRSATGLDDISVATDESGAASVAAGKYLTDDVYLEFGKGKAENSGEATIQIEVTPSINIESRIGQDAQGGGGIFWKRDY